MASRTEAIAAAIAEELRNMASNLNGDTQLRSISFDVKIKPGTATIRSVVIRTERERVLLSSGS